MTEATATAPTRRLWRGAPVIRTDTDRRLRNHIRQIQALGFDVTLTSDSDGLVATASRYGLIGAITARVTARPPGR